MLPKTVFWVVFDKGWVCPTDRQIKTTNNKSKFQKSRKLTFLQFPDGTFQNFIPPVTSHLIKTQTVEIEIQFQPNDQPTQK